MITLFHYQKKFRFVALVAFAVGDVHLQAVVAYTGQIIAALNDKMVVQILFAVPVIVNGLDKRVRIKDLALADSGAG